MGKLYISTRRSVYLTLGTVNNLLGLKTKIFILCYHGIGDDTWAFSVGEKTFKKHMNYLKKLGYDFITLSELNSFLDGKRDISRPSIVITFDDGYKDILKVKNFIKKLRIKPTLFLLSNTKKANRVELANKRKFLNKKDVMSLVKDGWEIGCHTATHSDMFALTKSQMKEEVIDSKKVLEKYLNLSIPYIAYPKGRYSKKVLSSVKKAEYELGLSMDDGVLKPGINKLTIPRIGVDRTHSFAEFKVLFTPLVVRARGFMKGVGYGKKAIS